MATKFYYKVEFVRSSGVSDEVKERVKESLSRSLVGAWIEGNKINPWHDGDLGMLVEKQFEKKWSSPRFNSREMAKSYCYAHVNDGGYLTGTFYVDVEFGLRDRKTMKLRVSTEQGDSQPSFWTARHTEEDVSISGGQLLGPGVQGRLLHVQQEACGGRPHCRARESKRSCERADLGNYKLMG